MEIKKTLVGLALVTFMIGGLQAQDSKSMIKQVSAQFVSGADVQDGELLKTVLEPQSLQYVLIGGKPSMFTAEQYIQMINEKKLGGKPRAITYKHAELLGEHLAVVVLNAVSDEYDFLYQFSLMENGQGKWKIVGVTAEINKVSS